jgi:PAS domain S-box-containing protein
MSKKLELKLTVYILLLVAWVLATGQFLIAELAPDLAPLGAWLGVVGAILIAVSFIQFRATVEISAQVSLVLLTSLALLFLYALTNAIDNHLDFEPETRVEFATTLTVVKTIAWTGAAFLMTLGLYSAINDANRSKADLLLEYNKTKQALTEHRQYQRRVEDNEKRLKNVFGVALDGVIESDEGGNIIYWNEQAEKIFGWTSVEALGHTMEELIVPDQYREAHSTGMRHFIATGEGPVLNTRIEITALRKSGEEFPVELGITPIRVVDKWQFTAFLRDISERKTLELQLLHTQKMEQERTAETVKVAEDLTRLIDTANAPIFGTDSEGNVNEWNQKVVTITGYTKEETMGRNLVSDFITQDYQEQVQQVLKKALSGDETSNFEVPLYTKSGARVMILLNATTRRDVNGEAVGVIGVGQDITYRKKVEAQLSQQQKLESIGTLASGVAHEINNPLTGIINYAQIIVDDLEKESELREYAEGIKEEAERVAEIVADLLSFAREDKESHSLSIMSDIVNRTTSLIKTIIHKDQITLDVDISEDLPQIKCRSQQVQQVLMNLLTNARDALNQRYPAYDENKIVTVTVRVFEQDGRRWLRTTVEDHGTGIDKETRERMFDPFFTTKDRATGTGLGLSISHGIVLEHHGRLSVESEPGEYTRIHFDLPVDNGSTSPGEPEREERTE